MCSFSISQQPLPIVGIVGELRLDPVGGATLTNAPGGEVLRDFVAG